jgi:hypothetical protein
VVDAMHAVRDMKSFATQVNYGAIKLALMRKIMKSFATQVNYGAIKSFWP